MVGKSGEAKLIDFGDAIAFKEGEFIKGGAGDESICSPARLKGEPYTEKCDMWSVGVILYQMLTFGFSPFKNNEDRKAGNYN